MTQSRLAHSSAGLVVLTVKVGSRACAIELAHTVETMRPLPMIAARPGAPLVRSAGATAQTRSAPLGTLADSAFVLGHSVIRGATIPVIDALALLGEGGSAEVTRLVVLRLGDERVALAVGRVIGVHLIDSAVAHALPSLVADHSPAFAALAAVSERLPAVLRAMRILPAGVEQGLVAHHQATA